jgi:hypothetical protein
MLKKLILAFQFFIGISCFGQIGTNPNYMTSKSVIALNAGAGFFKYYDVELGFAYAKYTHSGQMRYGRGYGISGMVVVDTIPCYGPKLQCWMNGGSYHISLGAWTAFLMNSRGNSLRVCPQVGFGSKRWRVNYGYSFAVTGGDLLPANTHTVSLNILVDLLTLKRGELGADRTMQKKKKTSNFVPR